jgi:hypothetical protein
MWRAIVNPSKRVTASAGPFSARCHGQSVTSSIATGYSSGTSMAIALARLILTYSLSGSFRTWGKDRREFEQREAQRVAAPVFIVLFIIVFCAWWSGFALGWPDCHCARKDLAHRKKNSRRGFTHCEAGSEIWAKLSELGRLSGADREVPQPIDIVDIADTVVSFAIAEDNKELAAWWYAVLPVALLFEGPPRPALGSDDVVLQRIRDAVVKSEAYKIKGDGCLSYPERDEDFSKLEPDDLPLPRVVVRAAVECVLE